MRTSSMPAVILMTLLALAGCVFVLTKLDIQIPLQLMWTIGIGAAGLGFVVLLVRTIRRSFLPVPVTSPHRSSFEPHDPERIKAVIGTYNRSSNPDGCGSEWRAGK